MTTQRFARMFENLKARNEGAFVAFVNVCDPSEEESLAIFETLVASGVDALELGIPFSDPCADGPVIMESAKRAIAAGATTEKCMKVIKAFRERHPEVPVSLMIYTNLVCAPGVENFFAMCRDAGVDAVLMPDLPLEMRAIDHSFDMAADAHGVGLVAIAPPNARKELLAQLSHASAGYVYLLSRPGITGENNPAHMPAEAVIEGLAEHHAAPGLLGFGVSTPQHVKDALACGASGVIVGSAIVRIINANIGNNARMHEEIAAYVSEMKAATRRG